MPFRHTLRVRYGEVDMQKHVFNAHYLSYADDACNAWFRHALGEGYYDGDMDFVVKRAEVTWHGSATFDDLLAIDVAPRRWGNTSFDIGFEGSVDGQPVFDSVLTYVFVDPETRKPSPVPSSFRAALSEPVAAS